MKLVKRTIEEITLHTGNRILPVTCTVVGEPEEAKVDSASLVGILARARLTVCTKDDVQEKGYFEV